MDKSAKGFAIHDSSRDSTSFGLYIDGIFKRSYAATKEDQIQLFQDMKKWLNAEAYLLIADNYTDNLISIRL